MQHISLGAFEPFHDMVIFNLSGNNKFKIPFSLVGGYVLDSLMGLDWDVKPLRGDVRDCHFKFVTLLTVYLDKRITLSSHCFVFRGFFSYGPR